MSIFKTHWIILKIKKIDEKKFVYTIFTQQYWKLLYNKSYSQREKSLDIGYAIQFETRVKQWVNIHTIQNIQILHEFKSINVWFNIIHSFLLLLSQIDTYFPLNLEHSEVYETVIDFLQYQEHIQAKNISQKLILMALKIKSLSGNLDESNNNPTIQKILAFVQNNKASNILRLSWITPDHEILLQELI